MALNVLGYWLIAAAIVWTAGVVVLVVVGLTNTEGRRGSGCRGNGCRGEAGGQGCEGAATPGGEGSPSGAARSFRVVRPGLVDIKTRSE